MAVPKKKNKKVKFKYSKLKLYIQYKLNKLPYFCQYCFKKFIKEDENHVILIYRRVYKRSMICDTCINNLRKKYKEENFEIKKNNIKKKLYKNYINFEIKKNNIKKKLYKNYINF